MIAGLLAVAAFSGGGLRSSALSAAADVRLDLRDFEDDARTPPDAPERAVVAEAAPTGDIRIDALLSPYQWSEGVITYSFYSDQVFGGQYYGTETGVHEVGESVKRHARAILAWYETALGLSFVEVTETPTTIGQIRFMFSDASAYAYAYYPTSSAMFHLSGDIHLNSAYDRLGDTNGFQHGAGEHGYAILIHEIGHALGLKHSFSGSIVLPAEDDNSTHTVMSYTFVGRSPATPMPYDILALQYLYGARASRMSADRYVFTRPEVDQYRVGDGLSVEPSGPTQQTMWDGGGYNVIDLSQAGGSATGYRIDARPLGWITTGANFLTTYMMAGTAIGPGVRIHEVVTSPDDDTVYLNAETNVVRGYGPGIVSGRDVLVGGTDADTLDLSGYAESAVTQTAVGADLVVGLGAAGQITLRDYYAGARVNIDFSSGAIPNQPPVAVATATPSSGVAPLTVTFSAAGTNDVDGHVVSHAWTLPGATASGPAAQYTFAAAGTYPVTLTVTDDDGATASAVTTVTVTAPTTPPASTGKNRNPTAIIAAEPTTGSAPLTVQFNGTGSFDADGTIVSYEWSFGNGATATGSTAGYTYTTPGTYLATLAVTDNRGAKYSQAVWVTVSPGSTAANRPPVASASATPQSGAAPLPVTFSAAGSWDPDGSLVSYAWTFGDGATGTGAVVGHTYSTPGIYVATLTVTDNRGATSRATTSVIVEAAGNHPPLAVITGAPLSGRAPLTVNFSGSDSSDPEGPVSSHVWSFGDGGGGSGVTASHTYTVAGTYLATLTVTDALGATHSATVTVSVSSALPLVKNRAPIPVMTVTPDVGAAPLVVTFDSVGSADLDGTIATYEWAFGNGASATGPTVTHRYTTPGTYLATLSVTDDRGLRNVAAAWVTVTR